MDWEIPKLSDGTYLPSLLKSAGHGRETLVAVI